MSPDDTAWLEQVQRHATALKIAIDGNRKIPDRARLDAMRQVDVATTIASSQLRTPAERDQL